MCESKCYYCNPEKCIHAKWTQVMSGEWEYTCPVQTEIENLEVEVECGYTEWDTSEDDLQMCPKFEEKNEYNTMSIEDWNDVD